MSKFSQRANCPRRCGDWNQDLLKLDPGLRPADLEGPAVSGGLGQGSGLLLASQLSSLEQHQLQGACSAPSPSPPGARGSGGSQPCLLADEERWAAGGGSWNSPCRLFRERGPVVRGRSWATPARTCAQSLPLEEARPARSQPHEGRNPGWKRCCARARRPRGGHRRCPPVRLSARCGEPGRRRPGLGFLKISGAARRRSDWPRRGNLYANEAAPPPRRRDRRAGGQSGGVRAGAGRAHPEPCGQGPRRSRPEPARPPRGGVVSPAPPPPPPDSLPAPPPPAFRTTFPSDRL